LESKANTPGLMLSANDAFEPAKVAIIKTYAIVIIVIIVNLLCRCKFIM
jgi:hypothetical protein